MPVKELLNARDTVERLAAHRRSIRRYRTDAIPQHDLLALLRTASRAPSPWNLQPWRFVVVRDSQAKKQLREAAFGQPQVEAASAVVVVYSDIVDALARVGQVQHPAWPSERQAKTVAGIVAAFDKMTPDQRDQWGLSQAYIALGYLLLAAEAFAFGSSPMLGFDPTKVKAQFQLPDHARVAALVAMGYPDEEGLEPYRFPVEAITRFL
jgi:nitroreductase